jgi:hypothetical protein
VSAADKLRLPRFSVPFFMEVAVTTNSPSDVVWALTDTNPDWALVDPDENWVTGPDADFFLLDFRAG